LQLSFHRHQYRCAILTGVFTPLLFRAQIIGTRLPTRCWSASTLRLQHCRQPSRTGTRGGDLSPNPVTHADAVKAVTVMSNSFDCLQVHHGMPSDLDERIATKPLHEVSQRIVSRKLFPHSMDPSAPIPSQHRCNLAAGE